MTKRILSVLICLIFLLTPAAPALAAEDGPVAVGSAEELLKIADDPDGEYFLTADIDLAGVDWVPVPFYGKLDGRGHSIYNLRVTSVGAETAETVDGNDKKYDSVFAGLFSTMIGAQVRDLTLQGVDIEIRSERHCFIGALAGYVKNSLVTDCRILDARLTLTSAIQKDDTGRTSCNAGVGGMAGFGTLMANGCELDVTLVFVDECQSTLKVEQFLGGVLANGNPQLYGTAVTIRGYAECNGYAHNGGLVGMTYQYDKSETMGSISGGSVSGFITFYENNTDPRAYCEAFVGEMLSWVSVTDMTVDFQRDQINDYTARLRPEKCQTPSLTETVHVADCYNVGYTEHACSVCGNTWRDSFVPPAHDEGTWTVTTPASYTESGVRSLICGICGQTIREAVINPHVDGDWVVAAEADYGQEGLRQLICAECGDVLREEIIPARVAARSVTIEPTHLDMDYQSSAQIAWSLEPAEVYSPMVYFSSSDESVATVETNGTVHAVGRGQAVITCSSADGFASAECTVTVKLTLMQWIRYYILFGWVLKH